MTLEEAIEIDKELLKLGVIERSQDYTNALQLGIEALKWRLHNEKVAGISYRPLPGQTKD